MKRKKDKRIHRSTFRAVSAAILAGVVVLTFTYTYAWGQRMKAEEQTEAAYVFMFFETETIYGEAFTRENIEGSGITAFNVWETT